MTTLHDRLADLAADAPPGGPVPDLWDRGRKVARARRVGTAVIVGAAVVLLAVIATLDWQRPAPRPEPARGPVGLPDRVWAPSSGLPTVERPGRLVAIREATRGRRWGSDTAVVGISATTGDYAFLDLPDLSAADRPSLAPDGRHVAYWLTGRPAGAAVGDRQPVVGLAVVDLETGGLTRHLIETAHGMDAETLVWVDSTTLLFEVGQRLNSFESSRGGVQVWRLGEDPRPLAGDAADGFEDAAGGWVLSSLPPPETGSRRVPTRSTHLLTDLSGSASVRRVELPVIDGRSVTGLARSMAIDRSGSRIALQPSGGSPSAFTAGRFGELKRVPRSGRTMGIVTWLDDDTVATLAQGPVDGGGDATIRAVDVSTGTSRVLVRSQGGDASVSSWIFATDLLSAPPVRGVQPPTPLDPRVTTELTIATVVAAAGALVLWRRRARA